MDMSASEHISRRDFLRAGTTGVVAAFGGLSALAQDAKKARIPIALQLYSVRDDCNKDLAGVLSQVGKMGYEGVEFAGFYGKKAEDLRKMLDDNGLKGISSHTGLEALEGEQFEKTVAFHKTLGALFIMVPGLAPKYQTSHQGWLDAAKKFDEIAAKLEPHGLRIGYHNHSAEFKPLEGELPWDTLFSNTSKKVIHQMDTGNCMSGGGDPVSFIKKYAGRSANVHLKEFEGPGDFGQGKCPWDQVFEACETVGGTEWYIIEQENYNRPPLDCVKQCLDFMREKGKTKA